MHKTPAYYAYFAQKYLYTTAAQKRALSCGVFREERLKNVAQEATTTDQIEI